MHIERVLVIGLDCATPQFVFGPNAFDLPNLRALAARGCWGLLRSCDPPITVPAWTSMMSSKDPGTLGCYGFRNRTDHSYEGMTIANASAVKDRRVWDILSRQGKRVVVLSVPQTYPPRPVNGYMVGCFLTPSGDADYTYPRTLKKELEAAVGPYLIDVKDFRTEDKGRLLGQLYDLMENRFAQARYLLTSKPWDFFMMVEMGVDRLHHGFWKYGDPGHPKFEPGNPYEHAMRDYYQALDARIGQLLSLVGDETAILVVSDHGAKAMVGGVCVNQWLIREGLLALDRNGDSNQFFSGGTGKIGYCPHFYRIDWSRTKVWGSGGYYGRLFFNVAGREPQGIVPPGEYEALRDDVAARIEAMTDPRGAPLGNKAHKPAALYRAVNGVPPDLIVYFGDLRWRAVGSVGYDDIYTFENDTGPDDANHDYHGIFIMDDGRNRGGREVRGLHLMDVAPTILWLLGVEVPADMQGKVIE